MTPAEFLGQRAHFRSLGRVIVALCYTMISVSRSAAIDEHSRPRDSSAKDLLQTCATAETVRRGRQPIMMMPWRAA